MFAAGAREEWPDQRPHTDQKCGQSGDQQKCRGALGFSGLVVLCGLVVFAHDCVTFRLPNVALALMVSVGESGVASRPGCTPPSRQPDPSPMTTVQLFLDVDGWWHHDDELAERRRDVDGLVLGELDPVEVESEASEGSRVRRIQFGSGCRSPSLLTRGVEIDRVDQRGEKHETHERSGDDQQAVPLAEECPEDQAERDDGESDSTDSAGSEPLVAGCRARCPGDGGRR